MTVSVPGSGSKLIGGSLQTQVTRDEVRQVLVEGFMPRVALDEKPATRRSGFQEFGLPYAADPAITRYLAAFLTAHRHAGEEGSGFRVQERQETWQETGDRDTDPARPDVVLFNGGVFAVADACGSGCWIRLPTGLAIPAPAPGPGSLPVLDNDRLDLAVARGAAYYGMVRRGEGVKIVASLARTYYIGVESPRTRSDSRTPNPEPSHGRSLPRPRQCRAGAGDRTARAAVRSARLGAGRVSALYVEHPPDRPARRAGAGRSRANDRPAADPHGPQNADPPRAGHRACASARQADRDRHAGAVVPRSGGRAHVAAGSSMSARRRRPKSPPTKATPSRKDSSTRRPRRPAAKCSRRCLAAGKRGARTLDQAGWRRLPAASGTSGRRRSSAVCGKC